MSVPSRPSRPPRPPPSTANRRAISSTVVKAAPQATPSTSQSLARRRRTRPGASSPRAARGTSLSVSSAREAMTTDAEALPTATPASCASKVDTPAVTGASIIPVENTPETKDHDTVLARASRNQATTAHTHPIHAPSAVRSAGHSTTATRRTPSATHVATTRTRLSRASNRDWATRAPSTSHHSRRGSACPPRCSDRDTPTSLITTNQALAHLVGYDLTHSTCCV